jgi:RNA polymerase sigma factor for flagellar operon FliA
LGVARRDQLISSHTDVARRIALRMARKYPAWVAREDLIAAGMLGLTEAAARYDDTREEPFLSFAEHRIRGAVLDELRRGDLLPRRARKLARRIAAIVADLERASLPITEDAIAHALGVTVEAYRTASVQLQTDIAVLDGDDVVSDRPSPEVEADEREALGRVRDALAQLDARDVTILGLHYHEDLTYQQIGRSLGVTPTRVCQLLWRAIERLRLQLA